jgi:hypothetical protein
MSNGLPDVVGVTIEAVFNFAGQELAAPIAGLAASSLAAYLADRYRSAKSILISELQHAGASAKDFEDAKEFAAGAFRYTRATRDQAADENLRLLAQAMIGLARSDKLWASDFIKYADMLAPLSRDEIIVIGELIAEYDKQAAKQSHSTARTAAWGFLCHTLLDRGLFPSRGHIEAVAVRAQRSGLITAVVTGGVASMPSGTVYAPSALAHEVKKFVDMAAALKPR